jgi:hypothetical protein
MGEPGWFEYSPLYRTNSSPVRAEVRGEVVKGPRMVALHRCRRSETILAHAGRVRLAPVDSNDENRVPPSRRGPLKK